MRLAIACLFVGAFLLINVLILPRAGRTVTAGVSLLPAAPGPLVDDFGAENNADIRLQENLVQQTYKVQGDSPLAIRAFMSTAGPVAANDARRYDSVTNWSLSWSMRYNLGPRGCSLAAATINLAISEVLPEIDEPGGLAPELAVRWRGFVAGLRSHEDGHVERERVGAAVLKAAFASVGPASNCGTLGAMLNTLGQRAIEQIKTSDASWDQETSHGRLQGAVFP